MSYSNLHTCEKAAPGWQRTGTCQQCVQEKSFERFAEMTSGVAPAQAAPAQPKTAICAQCETPIHKRKDDDEWVHEDNTMECFLGHSVKAWPKWDRSTLRVVEAEAPRGDQPTESNLDTAVRLLRRYFSNDGFHQPGYDELTSETDAFLERLEANSAPPTT